MLEKRMFLFVCMIIGHSITVCSAQVVNRCSKWSNSSRKHIFGRENGSTSKNIDGLDLRESADLNILPNTGEIVLLDDGNHRILVSDFNQSNTSTIFAILSDSSNSTNSSTIHNSPSAISHNGINSIYIVDTWMKQFIRISYPLQYGENATMINNSLSSLVNLASNRVGGLCVDPIDGSIFISDYDGHRIIRYNSSSWNGIYVGNGTQGNSRSQLDRPTSIAMNDNRTLFVNDANNRRIQMFPFNSSNATTLPISTYFFTRLSLYSSEILVFNTESAVHLFNLTSNSPRCILGCPSSPQFNEIRSAVIDKNGTLYVLESNRLISFSMYIECPEEPSTVMSTQNIPSSRNSPSESSTTTMTSESSSRPVSAAQPPPYYIPVNNCPPGKFGVNCSANDNICDLNRPCLNSGSCSLNPNKARGYDCQCEEYFQGINCEDDQRPCKLFTCYQRGECVITSKTSYECHCDRGYEGNQCEKIVNFCANVTCQNRGICFPEFLNYTCNCLPGFYGQFCESAETGNVVRGYVRKSFGYVAIIMLGSVVGFIIVMDVLKYGFGIDPVKTDRDALKKKQKEEEQKKKKKKNQRPKVAYRFEYIN